MEYTIIISNQFKKDFRRCIKRGLNMKLITDAMELLKATGTLPAQYRPHKLKSQKVDTWECHIQPDWLLIWKQIGNELELLMLNTGTHSDLFSKKYKKR